MAATFEDTLAAIRDTSVAVCGDLALDAYWHLDPGWQETSLETGRKVHRVAQQSYGLGGAANIAANALALGCRPVALVGVLGDDPFGAALRRIAQEQGLATEDLIVSPAVATTVFGKPHSNGNERERLDFGTGNEFAPELGKAFVAAVAAAGDRHDVVVLDQQLPRSVISLPTIGALNEVIATRRVVVSSRTLAHRFQGAVVVLNADEAARWLGGPKATDPDQLREQALALHVVTRQPAFVTAGSHGLVVADRGQATLVPAIALGGPIDPVGAGDAVTAAVAAVLGAGGDPIAAAHLANLAAAVTVTKIRTTGTATPDEIRALVAQHPT